MGGWSLEGGDDTGYVWLGMRGFFEMAVFAEVLYLAVLVVGRRSSKKVLLHILLFGFKKLI